MIPVKRIGLNLLNDGGQLQLLRVNGVRNVPEDYDQGNFPSEDGTGTCDWATNPGRWETGNITSYKSTADFMYVRGDGSKAYASAKMKSFTRQLMYLTSGIIVIMDRVVTTKPELKKNWLLHSINEPVISEDGKSFELSDKGGSLVCIPVLPHQVRITKIGGPGNEMLVDTTRFKTGMQSVIAPSELHYAEIPGAWRIEATPPVASTEDYFLNVIQVKDKSIKSLPRVKVLSESVLDITILVTTSDGYSATLKFIKGEDPGAYIKLMKGGRVIANEKMPDAVELEKGRAN